MKFKEACKKSNQNAAICLYNSDTFVCSKEGTCLITECRSYKCNISELPEDCYWEPLPNKSREEK